MAGFHGMTIGARLDMKMASADPVLEREPGIALMFCRDLAGTPAARQQASQLDAAQTADDRTVLADDEMTSSSEPGSGRCHLASALVST